MENLHTTTKQCKNANKIYKHYGQIKAEEYLKSMQSIEEKRKFARQIGDNTYISVRDRNIMKKLQQLGNRFDEAQILK